MENLKARSMEISTLLNNVNKISSSVGIGDNYTKKSLENEVSPNVDPVVQAAFGEAKERVKKLEQDYQRTDKNYREIQLIRYRCYIEGNGLKHHRDWAGSCIRDCKDLVEQLQNVLNSLHIKEASERGTEAHIKEASERGTGAPNHRKKFLVLHGCRSLAQEKMILQEKAEHTQPNNDKLSEKAIDFEEINMNFRRVQRQIPRTSTKKHVHDLLSRIKETNKLRQNAIMGGAMLGNNTTSQDSIKISTSIVIKLLANVIKELKKETGEADNILRDKRRIIEGYTEKLRHIQEKKEWLCAKWDDERKYMLGLENIKDGLEYIRPDSDRTWMRRETSLLPFFCSCKI